MSEHTVTHSTFTLERVYDATPERVFQAWADPALKARWWVGVKEADVAPMDLDFRVGGYERISGGPEGGPLFTYEGCFRDIVPGERIVLTNEMHADDKRISVNLVSVEFVPEGSGTRVTVTDHGAYLDDLDKPEWREGGTRDQLEALAVLLKDAAA